MQAAEFGGGVGDGHPVSLWRSGDTGGVHREAPPAHS